MSVTFKLVGSTAIGETAGDQIDSIAVDSGLTGDIEEDVIRFPSDVETVFADALGAGALGTAIQLAGDGNNDLLVSGTGTINGLGFVDANGNPLAGEPSGIYTLDGNQIFLFSDPNNDNLVYGYEGNGDSPPDLSTLPDLAFAVYLDETSSNGAITGGSFYTALFEPIRHPDGSDADDFVTLTDSLHVSADETLEFDFSGAPSGSNKFMAFGTATQAIVVTGTDINQTVNSGQGGGATTLGTNSQNVAAGQGLYFTFVSGMDPNFLVPGLTSKEASNARNIRFRDTFEADEVSFKLVKVSTGPSSTFSVKLTAQTTDPEPATGGDPNAFFNGLTDDTQVNIVAVFVNGVDITNTNRVDLSGNTAVVSGLKQDDIVTYATDGDHNRVLIQNAEPTRSNIQFSIADFSVSDTTSTVTPVGDLLAFYDDGPAITADGAIPVLVTDDTDVTDTASADFSGVFGADFGADGDGGLGYALSVTTADSGLVDAQTDQAILLRMNGAVVEGYLAATGELAFTLAVDAAGMVTQTQYRAIEHDDAADPAETGASAAALAAGAVALSATATDGDGDTATATVDISGNVRFEDDGPAITADNLVGTGTTEPQVSRWTVNGGSDGLAMLGLTLDGYRIGNVSGDISNASVTGGTLVDGNWEFTLSINDDFNKDGTIAPDEILQFDLVFAPDGTYTATLSDQFGSEVPLSSSNGKLGAGGPDPVQTLSIESNGDGIVNADDEQVVFFGVSPIASTANILAAIGPGATDPTELKLEALRYSFISTQNMNVSTAGIGIGNNNLDGSGAKSPVSGADIGAGDESFVVNPEGDMTSAKLYIDNSVAGYDTSTESLYYTIHYADGSSSAPMLVTAAMLSTEAGGQKSFVVDGGGELIDAIQLTMGAGSVKIPTIEFTFATTSILDPVYLDLTATVTDGDGDTASSSFSMSIETDENPLDSNDLSYVDTEDRQSVADDQGDVFNFDFTGSDNTWAVSGFDTGIDTLAIAGATAASITITQSGSDALVTAAGGYQIRLLDAVVNPADDILFI